MTDIIIPHDPLDDEIEILPTPVEEIILDPLESTAIELPIENNELPIVDSSRPVFKELNKDYSTNKTSTQYLPNVLTSKEDLELCLQHCLEIMEDEHGTVSSSDNINGIIEAFRFLSINMYGDNYNEFFEKNVGKLSQYVLGEQGKKIRINHPDYAINGNVLTGSTAARYIKRETNTGKITKIPLWHSGIILILSPFTTKEQADITAEIEGQIYRIGRKTNGASYSGDDVILTSILLEHILNHVTDTNLKDKKIAIGKLIDVTDIPFIMAGALESIYPNGHPVYHVCVNKAKNACNYVITAKKKEDGDYYPDSLIDFSEVSRINEDYLSSLDKQHMSAQPNTHTVEQIREYKSRIADASRNKIVEKSAIVYSDPDESEKFKIIAHFKVPNLVEYSVSGLEWVESIKKMAEQALGYNTNNDLTVRSKENIRSEHIDTYSKITELVKHVGWIDYFSTSKLTKTGIEEYRITDPKGIRETLESLVSLEGASTKFEAAIMAYKVNCIIGTTGIPNFVCPSCKSGQTEPNTKMPSLIPINLVGYFFSSMAWQIATYRKTT